MEWSKNLDPLFPTLRELPRRIRMLPRSPFHSPLLPLSSYRGSPTCPHNGCVRFSPLASRIIPPTQGDSDQWYFAPTDSLSDSCVRRRPLYLLFRRLDFSSYFMVCMDEPMSHPDHAVIIDFDPWSYGRTNSSTRNVERTPIPRRT